MMWFQDIQQEQEKSGHTVISVGKELKCVDDLGSEGAIFRNCQEAMLGGRLPELRERVQKDRILRMDQILEVQKLGNPEVNSIIEQSDWLSWNCSGKCCEFDQSWLCGGR